MKKFLLSTALVILFVFSSDRILMAKPNLQAAGTIRGGVYLDENGDGLCVSADEGKPIPDIDVVFRNGDQTIVLYSGSNGTYGLPRAGQGVWEVTVQPDPTLWQVTSANSKQVYVFAGSGLVQLNVDFCLQPNTSGGTNFSDTTYTSDTSSTSEAVVSSDSNQFIQEEEVDVIEEIRVRVNAEATEPLTAEQEVSAIATELLTNPPEPQPDPNTDVYANIAIPVSQEEGWLTYLNLFREMGHLPRLQMEESISGGSQLHSRYMVLLDEPIAHREDPAKDLYTPPGDNAARNSNIFATTQAEADYKWGVNFWMSAPFHQVPLIDPELVTVGYGDYNKDVGVFNMAAVLDVRSEESNPDQAIDYPIYFPAQDSETWIVRQSMYEWPDPLESCPGYVRPVGPSIVLQLGDGSETPRVTGHRFMKGDLVLNSCLFHETSYVNSDPFAQSTGRAILDERDAIVILPQLPLEMGAVYTVEIFADGYSYVWSFTTGPVPELE